MNKNEIKKALYQQKPEAEYAHTANGYKVYSTEIIIEGQEEIIEFEVPFDDGAAMMEDKLPAQLLIRWLQD